MYASLFNLGLLITQSKLKFSSVLTGFILLRRIFVFFDSLHDILDSLVKVLPSGPETNMVIEDIRRILDGVLSLDVLKDSVIGESEYE